MTVTRLSSAGGGARRPRPIARRRLAGLGFGAAGALLLAACAPAATLSPARPRGDGRPRQDRPASTPTPAPMSARANRRPPPTPNQAATPAALATPTPPSTRLPLRSPGGVAYSHGRPYRIYPETAGVVEFASAWAGAQTALIDELVAEMAARYPSITVEHEAGDALWTRERLVAALAGGTPPNVLMLGSGHAPYFADQGVLLSLDGLLGRDGIAADWFGERELAGPRWDGHLVGLPHVAAGAEHLLFVNLGLLERIGADPGRAIETWQDLSALVEPAREAGLQVLHPTRTPAGATLHQLLTYANGGRYWDDELRTIDWASDPAVEAAGWLLAFQKAQRDGQAAPPVTDPAPATTMSPEEWAEGRYLCCLNGVGWLFELQQQAPQLRFAVHPFPRNRDRAASIGATPATGGWIVAIPTAARDQDAAWEWVKLLTVSESACAFFGRQRRPSPLVGCDAHASLAATLPFWSTVSASLTRSVTVPAAPVRPRLEQLAGALHQELLRARRPVREVLETAAREAQQLLDDWHAKRGRR